MAETPEPTNPISRDAIESAVAAALAAIAEAATLADLKTVRTAHLGEHAPLARLNARMREVPGPLKRDTGKLLGAARGRVRGAFEEREGVLGAAERARRLERERVDVTAGHRRERIGARHPISLLIDEVSDLFVGMGWEIADGPEIENEWYNFDAMNFDADHPARALQDTFFVDPIDRHLVLRTHTSPVQMRSMLTRPVPLYILAPGRTYRTDALDATHTPVFHQFEGLAVDRGLTMAHLRGTLEHAARVLFGRDARIRLRNNYFPFTEPSAEMDVWHPHAKGGPRWIEWGGCGMVHPNVLRAGGIDPDEYRGFAFGMGIDRTLMFRRDLPDMHDIVEGDIRFSEQYGQVI